MDLIRKYFPDLTVKQQERFEQLEPLYVQWNERINVISRKDIENLYEHHVLHSLGIAKIITFKEGTSVLDVGTGGGFPGIPLAILFPDTKFHLIDSTEKKINVVNTIAKTLSLTNVFAEAKRAEEISGQFDFITCRAVTTLLELSRWIKGKTSQTHFNDLPNGILYLKGGDISDELKTLTLSHTIYELKDYFAEEFFTTKKLIHLYRKS